MKDRFPSIVALIILVTLTMTTWLTSQWIDSSISEPVIPRMTHEMDTFADNFLFIRSNPQGYPVSRLQGKRIEHFPDDNTFEIQQPLATQQSPNNPQIFISSDTGKLFDENAQLLLQGKARFWRPEAEGQAFLEASSASFLVLLNEDIVRTDDNAVIVHGVSRISGSGMRYNNVERTLNVLNQSRVEINQP